jgi:type II secretion system protein H
MEKELIKKKGYTLIELLVVGVIIALMSSLSLAWYGNFREDKNLDKQIQTLAQVLNGAKAKARRLL